MKKFYPFVAMALIFLFLGSTRIASAKTYVWVDHNGTTRTTKYPPLPHQVKKTETAGRGSTTRQNKPAQQVDLYVTSWCPYCKKAENFFRSRGIPFRSYDIEKDRAAAARKNKLDKKSGVPFAVINGKYIRGYAPEKYSKALQ